MWMFLNAIVYCNSLGLHWTQWSQMLWCGQGSIYLCIDVWLSSLYAWLIQCQVLCVYIGQRFHVSFVELTIQRTICVCVWSVCYLTSEAQRGFIHESSGLASIIAVLWAAYTSHRGAWHLDCKALTHQRLEWKKRKKFSGLKLSKHDDPSLFFFFTCVCMWKRCRISVSGVLVPNTNKNQRKLENLLSYSVY